ncbi:hypothetical protein HJ581_0046395 [Rhodococcus opacus]|nr:hypothetical protein HJ581_0046395 [Rhodococcus opacus]
MGDDAYVGAHFDAWSSTGNRAGEAVRFTADDLVAAGVPVGAGPRRRRGRSCTPRRRR